MITISTAGESHGRAMIALISGIPSGVNIDQDFIDLQLARRQQGFGRGGRMKIETDKADILTGVMHGKTTGSPVTIAVWNRDWENWKGKETEPILSPRPGHADLSGAYKYNLTNDYRQVLERSSARETSARVAAGALVRLFLKEYGIEVFSHVVEFAGIKADQTHLDFEELKKRTEVSDLRMSASDHVLEQVKARISQAMKDGDTLGGTIELMITGVPALLGSYQTAAQKLDGRLASSILSVQAIKGVEFGIGFEYSSTSGKDAHDEIFYDKTAGMYYRKTNRAGGIEGGMTNGSPITIRAVKKPIPTLMSPLSTVNIITKDKVEAVKERSDTTAVPACSVVLEAVVTADIANALMERYGCDSVELIRQNLKNDPAQKDFRK